MIAPLILQIVLIFLNAIFASAEIAVISMNETKLKNMSEKGDKRAQRLFALTEQPAKFLATIQVAITLAGLLGSAFAADSFAGPLADGLIGLGVGIPRSVLNTIAVVVITLVLSYFTLVFGELVPKRIAMKKTESMALGMSGLLYGVAKVFAPLVFILTKSTNGVLRLLGINPNEEGEQVTEEEIRMLVLESRSQGNIDSEETNFIENVFEFDDMDVEQICTHRTDTLLLDADEDLAAWDEVIYESHHTNYPVFKENRENIIGILNTKTYFRLKERTKEKALTEALEKPHFVPETMKANVLFRKMQDTRLYFAVVLDEYGGLTGIITLHDLVEELVGNLYDLQEEVQPQEIEQRSENEWIIQGAADIQSVEKALDIELPEGDYDTFGGFILKEIDRIPEDHESFIFETNNLVIQVKDVESHRIMETITKKIEKIEK
ncbi:putative hemolysin [Lachnospiraceae bacterium PF1-21]|uniref:Hemolysin family protein n=1 Tax=Ohessyouella blattaphilus TaxID=2949333 RepID=A0ABT1EHA3_9FIRM|nr:hemolysin family protein [Ohessyouella blattaphilus]MCP1110084.1 hemolysin family protein [Ohessyouella blattaphilus]MCR8563478.1 hemolysin family protein [Ohessyouella blattaphilus]